MTDQDMQNPNLELLYGEWVGLSMELDERLARPGSADTEALETQISNLEKRIAQTSCVTMRDFAAKAMVAHLKQPNRVDPVLGSLFRDATAIFAELGRVEADVDAEEHAATRARLDQFASWTDTDAPAELLTEDGAPSPELLAYCRDHGLSLDWLFLGDVKPLVMAKHREAIGTAAAGTSPARH